MFILIFYIWENGIYSVYDYTVRKGIRMTFDVAGNEWMLAKLRSVGIFDSDLSKKECTY